MILHINGEPRDFAGSLTVAALVDQLGMKPDRVAVELNLEILPRTSWDTTALKDGDKLEIVHFVGGGSDRNVEEAADLADEPGTGEMHAWICPTCNAQGTGRFCPNCGEKKSSREDFSLHHFFSHAIEVLFHADSKIFRSFRVLFTKPGLLGFEYVRGHRKPYLHPFQLFFVANLIYFFFQPLTQWNGLKTPLYVHMNMTGYSALASRLVTQRLAVKGVSLAEFTRSFNHVIDLHARSLVVVMVPVFAVLLWALEWRKRRFFGEHLVFALHFYAFWLVALFIVLYGLSTPVLSFLVHRGAVFSEQAVDNFLSGIGAVVLVVYLSVAIRTFYHDKVISAAVKAAILTAGILYIMQLYRFILFLTSLYSV